MVYILAIILKFILIPLSCFQIILFDELKRDRRNPVDQCRSLNPLVSIEYGIHGLLVVIFLFCFEWLTVIINLPFLAYHMHRYAHRPVMSVPGLYDPTTIMNYDELNRGMKEGCIRLAFYIVTFFYYLYSVVYELMTQ